MNVHEVGQYVYRELEAAFSGYQCSVSVTEYDASLSDGWQLGSLTPARMDGHTYRIEAIVKGAKSGWTTAQQTITYEQAQNNEIPTDALITDLKEAIGETREANQ